MNELKRERENRNKSVLAADWMGMWKHLQIKIHLIIVIINNGVNSIVWQEINDISVNENKTYTQVTASRHLAVAAEAAAMTKKWNEV